jgi:hypothetical protein
MMIPWWWNVWRFMRDISLPYWHVGDSPIKDILDDKRIIESNTANGYNFVIIKVLTTVRIKVTFFDETLSNLIDRYELYEGEFNTRVRGSRLFQILDPCLPTFTEIHPRRKQTTWLLSASELYRTSDRRLSVKLAPTFAKKGCRVASAMGPHGRILGFLDRSTYYFFKAAPQLYSRGWVDHVPVPLHLRKSNSAGNLTRTSGFVARNSDR